MRGGSIKEGCRFWVDEAFEGGEVTLNLIARMRPKSARRLAEKLIIHADAVDAKQAKERARKRKK
jgi:hypothetical protein